MTDPYEPDLGFQPLHRAMAVMAEGRPVDFVALRAQLVHLADQHQAVARTRHAGWDVGELGAAMAPRWLSVVDRLEAGDAERALRRMRAVARYFCRHWRTAG